jgi:hypothetical protein
MRRLMVVEIHSNHDTQKTADLWHPAILSAREKDVFELSMYI